MRKEILSNHCFYHVFNRGVEKRKIFLNKNDYFRFVRGLFEFNNSNPSRILSRAPQPAERQPRDLFVAILCFCLMPNHFHLLLEQLVDDGIAEFMHKLGLGYTGYFNKKYERSGVLFQGTYKVVKIETEQQLLHVSRYIHINPIELITPNWKIEDIKKWGKINDFLEKYRWSSYLDYIEKDNFPSVTNRQLINHYFRYPSEHKEFIKGWLAKDWRAIEDLVIE